LVKNPGQHYLAEAGALDVGDDGLDEDLLTAGEGDPASDDDVPGYGAYIAWPDTVTGLI